VLLSDEGAGAASGSCCRYGAGSNGPELVARQEVTAATRRTHGVEVGGTALTAAADGAGCRRAAVPRTRRPGARIITGRMTSAPWPTRPPYGLAVAGVAGAATVVGPAGYIRAVHGLAGAGAFDGVESITQTSSNQMQESTVSWRINQFTVRRACEIAVVAGLLGLRGLGWVSTDLGHPSPFEHRDLP
jgi:hypothetical protein